MDFRVPPFFLFTASWFGSLAGVWALFDRTEKVISQETRESVSRWLHNVQLPTGEEWPKTFLTLFDNVFGKKHWSLRCFVRSAIASIASVLIVTLLWAGLRPGQFKSYFDEYGWLAAIWLITFPLMFNFVPDYLSLLETRLVLHWTARPNRRVPIVVLLAFDLILTTVVVALVIGGLMAVFRGWEDAWEILFTGFSLTSPHYETLTVGMFIYSTYLTSVWIWLYFLAGITAKVLLLTGKSWKVIHRLLDFDGQPVRSLGLLVMVALTVVYAFVALL